MASSEKFPGPSVEEAVSSMGEKLAASSLEWKTESNIGSTFSEPTTAPFVVESSSAASSVNAVTPSQTPGSLRSVKKNLAFACPNCSRGFDKRWKVNRCLVRHNPPFLCVACAHRFVLKKDREKHYWAKHPEFAERLQLYHCEIPGCTYQGPRKDTLTRHIRRVHASIPHDSLAAEGGL